jgi:hypothetical protein
MYRRHLEFCNCCTHCADCNAYCKCPEAGYSSGDEADDEVTGEWSGDSDGEEDEEGESGS